MWDKQWKGRRVVLKNVSWDVFRGIFSSEISQFFFTICQALGFKTEEDSADRLHLENTKGGFS